jgi:pilus assembly protein Flp/PilA
VLKAFPKQFAIAAQKTTMMDSTRNPSTKLLKEQNTMIKNFLQDETGLELSEYAVAAALIALGCVTAFTSLGGAIKGKINTLVTTLGGTAGA